MKSMMEATRSRARFSGHGGALGAAGYREETSHPDNCEFLNGPGQSVAISTKGFDSMLIGAAWESAKNDKVGFWDKLRGKSKPRPVDLDLGCLYELKDGTRGCLQAFGHKYGHFDEAPYMSLSGDERTGAADGRDEYILVNGLHWDKIKRIIVYIYIYEGAPHWSEIRPQIILDVPGENDLVVTLGVHDDSLDLCAVGGIENIRGHIKLTNYTEYFPGHEAMDRAFGFGLQWGDGQK